MLLLLGSSGASFCGNFSHAPIFHFHQLIVDMESRFVSCIIPSRSSAASLSIIYATIPTLSAYSSLIVYCATSMLRNLPPGGAQLASRAAIQDPLLSFAERRGLNFRWSIEPSGFEASSSTFRFPLASFLLPSARASWYAWLVGFPPLLSSVLLSACSPFCNHSTVLYDQPFSASL
ncbi:hypothetical protein DL93DRAFT_1162718 [Clavulina sp. PMI_390]|nr:hypothetical protein DL93DRAFT_1162718 [Clavulina sp. PMI_390]